MKRRGANGLGEGWVNRRGVKMTQLICKMTGSNSIRKEVPDLIVSRSRRRRKA